ncbi:MAG TPA: hypothetical protein VNO79_14230 [Actinomycetota bacterium]|nr:hypothetical protein [Actinomycetota bacterium]
MKRVRIRRAARPPRERRAHEEEVLPLDPRRQEGCAEVCRAKRLAAGGGGAARAA